MNKKERVLEALQCRVPDRIPYMYSIVDTEVQEKIVGHKLEKYIFDTAKDPGIIVSPGEKIKTTLNYAVHPETAKFLDLDAIGIKFNYPLFVKARLQRSGYAIEEGLLKSRQELRSIRMPDPDQDDILNEARSFIKAFGGEYAIYACIRMGISSMLMSMGYDTFSYMLYDDRDFILDVMQLYLDFNKRFIRNLEEVGFDFLWSFDDIAFGTGPLFSQQVWDDIFAENVGEVTRRIQIPWIYHSDGNLLPILDKMLSLGMNGIHPLEPGTMDLDLLKEKYGKRLCLIGNININDTLSTSPKEIVEMEVKERMEQLSPGGGFIISDSNSVPYFCNSENIIEMSRAVQKYRNIYI